MGKSGHQTHDYDVVIIGTGIGGLVTGAYLAKHGVRVLLCEQHRQPGGYFTSFKKKGFTFDGGIQACEDCGMLISLLEHLGIRDRIELHKSVFAYVTPDDFFRVRSPADISQFYASLAKAYPAEKEGIAYMSQKAYDLCRTTEAFCALPNPLFVPFTRLLSTLPGWVLKHRDELSHGNDLMQHMKIPMDVFFQQHFRDPDLIRFLNQLSYKGSPAAFVLGMIAFVLDYYYPKGGIQAISDLLAEFITEQGGTLRYKTLVEEIIVEQNHACGVRLKGGETIRSPFVISNSDARRTFLKMLPDSAVPPSYQDKLRAAELSESSFTVFLGVDIPSEELPTQGCHHIMFFPDYKGVRFTEDLDDPLLYSRAPLEISIPSVSDPALAPKGKTSMILQSIAVAEYGNQWGTKNGRRTKEYRALKEKVARQLINTAEKVVPGLSKKIVYMDAATPLTAQRYTLNDGGASAGWSYHPQKGLNAGLDGMLGFLTPVKNLYAVGHWTSSPGGAPSGFISGRIVSEIVRRRLGRSGS